MSTFVSKINGILVGTHFVRPTDFGCVGDGVVDDTNNFQHCIDYAIENGLNIDCEGKTYLISDSGEYYYTHKKHIRRGLIIHDGLTI
jgi:hypothetical protein